MWIKIYEQISAQLTITENHPHFTNSKKVSYRNALTWGDNLHRGESVLCAQCLSVLIWTWIGNVKLSLSVPMWDHSHRVTLISYLIWTSWASLDKPSLSSQKQSQYNYVNQVSNRTKWWHFVRWQPVKPLFWPLWSTIVMDRKTYWHAQAYF